MPAKAKFQGSKKQPAMDVRKLVSNCAIEFLKLANLARQGKLLGKVHHALMQCHVLHDHNGCDHGLGACS
jgi:hypothetical protein